MGLYNGCYFIGAIVSTWLEYGIVNDMKGEINWRCKSKRPFSARWRPHFQYVNILLTAVTSTDGHPGHSMRHRRAVRVLPAGVPKMVDESREGTRGAGDPYKVS